MDLFVGNKVNTCTCQNYIGKLPAVAEIQHGLLTCAVDASHGGQSPVAPDVLVDAEQEKGFFKSKADAKLERLHPVTRVYRADQIPVDLLVLKPGQQLHANVTEVIADYTDHYKGGNF